LAPSWDVINLGAVFFVCWETEAHAAYSRWIDVSRQGLAHIIPEYVLLSVRLQGKGHSTRKITVNDETYDTETHRPKHPKHMQRNLNSTFRQLLPSLSITLPLDPFLSIMAWRNNLSHFSTFPGFQKRRGDLMCVIEEPKESGVRFVNLEPNKKTWRHKGRRAFLCA